MPRKAPARKSSSKNLSIPLNSQTLLVVLLIVVSFFTGYLFFKVQSLEKGTAGNQAAAGGDQQAPALNLKDMPKVTGDDHLLGNKDAKVVLVEYSDFECPFCKQFQPTMQQLLKEYGDDVAWVYRHYPLSFHQNAQKEAEASECIFEQGGNDAFWKYADTIFERTQSNGTGFALEDLKGLAQEVGVDGDQFQQCLDSGKYADLVKKQQDGGTKAGISGTPGTIIVVNGEPKDLINGAVPFADAKAQIDAALK